MKKLLSIFLVSILLFSCEKRENSVTNNANDTQDLKDTTDVVENESEMESTSKNFLCFRQVMAKDTVLLQLERTGNNFEGKLVYNNYEKDGSFGTYKGSAMGDTLVGTYKFMSEGMVSEMEKIFLLSNGNLMEATGEMNYPDNGKVTFVSKDSLDFGEGHVLKLTDCGENFIPTEWNDYLEKLN